jgi:hypothetical protein
LDGDTLLVADHGNDRVQRFDLLGQPLGVLGAPVSATHVLSRPVDVAVGPDGAVFVADTGHLRVARLTTDGADGGGWGGPGAGPGGFDEISAVAASADGRVYALDASLDRVQAFASEHATTWRVEAYDGEWLSEAPVIVTDTAQLDVRWGYDRPPGVPSWVDVRSVRATRHEPGAGEHELALNSVGGVRLWAGERLLVDEWYDRSVVETVTATLPTGGALLRLEYRKLTGPLRVGLQVTRLDDERRLLLPLALR